MHKKNIITLLLISAALSMASFLLIAESVGEEPFLRFQAKHAWTQLVGSSITIVLWIALFAWTVYKIIKSIYSKRLVLLLIWILFILFWLIQTPYTYISDIDKFQNMELKRESTTLENKASR